MMTPKYVRKETPEVSCKSIAYLLSKYSDSELHDFMCDDLIYKFGLISACKEKKNIAIEALKPFVPNKLSPLLQYAEEENVESAAGARNTFDLIVFCVVPNEFSVVKKAFNLEEEDSQDLATDDIRFWKTEFYSQRENTKLSCLVTMIGESGNINTAVIVTKALVKYDFNLAILVGIAAGCKGKSNFADVVIANQVMDYETKRVEPDKNKNRPKCASIDSGLKKQINYFIASNLVLGGNFGLHYNSEYPKYLPVKLYKKVTPEISSSVILAGEKLLADGMSIETLVNEYHEQARGFEMEANGFVSACKDSNVPWLIFRGISDFGDSGKNSLKKYQQNAALSAILACKLFIENHYSPFNSPRF